MDRHTYTIDLALGCSARRCCPSHTPELLVHLVVVIGLGEFLGHYLGTQPLFPRMVLQSSLLDVLSSAYQKHISRSQRLLQPCRHRSPAPRSCLLLH